MALGQTPQLATLHFACRLRANRHGGGGGGGGGGDTNLPAPTAKHPTHGSRYLEQYHGRCLHDKTGAAGSGAASCGA